MIVKKWAGLWWSPARVEEKFFPGCYRPLLTMYFTRSTTRLL